MSTEHVRHLKVVSVDPSETPESMEPIALFDSAGEPVEFGGAVPVQVALTNSTETGFEVPGSGSFVTFGDAIDQAALSSLFDLTDPEHPAALEDGVYSINLACYSVNPHQTAAGKIATGYLELDTDGADVPFGVNSTLSVQAQMSVSATYNFTAGQKFSFYIQHDNSSDITFRVVGTVVKL